MSRSLTIAAAGVFMLGNWAATNAALAQTFEERWSPIPKAHAESNTQPQPNLAWVFMLGNWATTNVALAQTFEERWPPIPKAHKEPNTQPQPNSQPDPSARALSKPQVVQIQRPAC